MVVVEHLVQLEQRVGQDAAIEVLVEPVETFVPTRVFEEAHHAYSITPAIGTFPASTAKVT